MYTASVQKSSGIKLLFNEYNYTKQLSLVGGNVKVDFDILQLLPSFRHCI